ncbi:hypothetical protein CDIK_3793 [Cucumispora dikerogammari]|nr:hypothetical protein CDIK_3793 [Cucumispora dikerogammari]
MLNQLLSKLNFFNCQASIDSEINTRTNNRQKDGDESKNKEQTRLVHDSFKFINQVELDLAPFFNCCPGFVFEDLANELSIRLIEPGQEECNNSFSNYDFIPSDKLMESIIFLQVIIKHVEGYKYSVSIETKDEESKTRLLDVIKEEGKSFKLCILFFAPKFELWKKKVIGIIRDLEKGFEGLCEILKVFLNDINNKINDFNKNNWSRSEKNIWIKKDFKQSLDSKINKVKNIKCISKDIKKKLIVYLEKIKCNYLKIFDKNLTGDKREEKNKHVREAWNDFVVETTKFISEEIQLRCSENSEIVSLNKNFLEVEFKNKIVNFRSDEATFLKSLFSYMIYMISQKFSSISLETDVFKVDRIIDMLQESKKKSIINQELTKKDKTKSAVKDKPNISESDTTTQTGSALNEKDTTPSIILTEEERSSSPYKKIKEKQTEEQRVTFSVNSLKEEERSNEKDIIQGEGITHEEEIVKEDEITQGGRITKEGGITQGVEITKNEKITHGDKITKNDKTTQGEEITKKNKITHEEEIIKNDRKTQGGEITEEGGITQGEEITKEDEITQTVDQTKTHFDIDQRNTKKWLVMPISIGLINIFILVYLFLVRKRVVYEVEE